MERVLTYAEIIDVGHDIAHGVAALFFTPGLVFGLVPGAMVKPVPFESQVEAMAVAIAGPLFDMRLRGLDGYFTAPSDEVLAALTRYLDSDGEGSDARLFREMLPFMGTEDRWSYVLRIGLDASRTAALLYGKRRKLLGRIALALRDLDDTEVLPFDHNAIARMKVNIVPEICVRDLVERLQQYQGASDSQINPHAA